MLNAVARKQNKPATSKLRAKTERVSRNQSAAEVIELLKRGKLNGDDFCKVTNDLPPAERAKLLDELLREIRDLDRSRQVSPFPFLNQGSRRRQSGMTACIDQSFAENW
jgi:hypothetical protein